MQATHPSSFVQFIAGLAILPGTNHICHALFTKLLRPVLERMAKRPGADVRIISLSSSGHGFTPSGGFDPSLVKTDTSPWYMWRHYGQCKLANILFTVELAKRYPSIKSVVIHPGAVQTNLGDTWFNDLIYPLKLLLIIFGPHPTKTVQQGALHQLWAATATGVQSGKYYPPVGVENQASIHPRARRETCRTIMGMDRKGAGQARILAQVSWTA